MISRAIFTILTTSGAVTALIGTKLFPVRTPQTVSEPFSIYKFAQHPIDTKDGVATQDIFELQISSFASGFEAALNIEAAIRTALDRYVGTVQGVKIQTIVFIDLQIKYDDKAKLYQIDQIFNLRINR